MSLQLLGGPLCPLEPDHEGLCLHVHFTPATAQTQLCLSKRQQRRGRALSAGQGFC